MQVDLFREFVVLAEELNYHAAAKRLNVTQSTLSKHVALMEREYGVALFARDRSGVALTASGMVLLEVAQRIAAEYERSRELLATAAASRPLFVSGEMENPGIYRVVARAIASTSQGCPGFSPKFVQSASLLLDAQVQLLRSGEADLAVTSFDRRELAARPDADDFLCLAVYRAPVFALVSPANPLSAKAELSLSDMMGCSFVRLTGPRYSGAWRLLERQLHAANISFRTVPVAANSPYDFMGIDLGSSILLLPSTAGIPDPDVSGGAVPIPIRTDEMRLDLCALAPKERRHPMADIFVDALSRAFAEELD